jgi:hypothetical protein
LSTAEKVVDLPASLKNELAQWNNGAGIDVESWIGCEGRFALAVGYSSIFWPEFVEFDGYVLRKGFSESSLRGFEKREDSTRRGVEWVMNHLHIADIHHVGCADMSEDKLIYLGHVLHEIHQVKLKSQFPDRPCTVEFYTPKADDLLEYQITFWQKAHDPDTKP